VFWQQPVTEKHIDQTAYVTLSDKFWLVRGQRFIHLTSERYSWQYIGGFRGGLTVAQHVENGAFV